MSVGRNPIHFTQTESEHRSFSEMIKSGCRIVLIKTRIRGEFILRGSEERLAPILMTASVTGLALLPIIVGGNLPGHEIEYPMAVVIFGGLVTSTLLNLFLMPALYLIFVHKKKRRDYEPVKFETVKSPPNNPGNEFLYSVIEKR